MFIHINQLLVNDILDSEGNEKIKEKSSNAELKVLDNEISQAKKELQQKYESMGGGLRHHTRRNNRKQRNRTRR